LTAELNAGDRFDTKRQCWEIFQWLVQKEAMKRQHTVECLDILPDGTEQLACTGGNRLAGQLLKQESTPHHASLFTQIIDVNL
jgi:hypothetical protein